MNIIAKDIQTHWQVVQPLFSIRNEDEYKKAVEALNELVDEVGTNEDHPLYELLDTLGTLIHAYEEKYHPIPECSGIEMIKYLMEELHLEPSDFPELGPPNTVLAILTGDTELTVRHIHSLANKFDVNPMVFL